MKIKAFPFSERHPSGPFLLLAPALLVALSSPASAQTPEPEQPAEVWRGLGLGTAIGGGFAAPTRVTPSRTKLLDAGPALMLPTIELQFFTQQEYSVDLTVPITNIVVTSLFGDGLLFNTDVFFNINAGRNLVRLVAGPGIGFAVVAAGTPEGDVGLLRLPAQVGVEFLSKKRGLGFKILTRP